MKSSKNVKKKKKKSNRKSHKTAGTSAHVQRFPPNLDHRYHSVGLITNLLNPAGVVIMAKVDTMALAVAPSQQSDHIPFAVILKHLHTFGHL